MTTQLVHRPGRRVRPRPPADAKELAAPPVLPDSTTGGSGFQSLMPMIGVVSSMTIMITLRKNPVLVALGGVLLLVAGFGAVLLVVSSRGRATRSRRLHRERYLDYLEDQSAEALVDECAVRAAAIETDPDPAALIGLAGDPTRLWDRRRADPDFLRVRIGIGTVAWRRIAVPDAGTPIQPTDTFLRAEASRIAARYSSADGMPLRVPLDRTGDIAIIGPPRQTLAAARALLSQVIALHAPEDVALALVCPPQRCDDWAGLAWAPHLLDDTVLDAPVAVRRTAPDMASLAGLLDAELGQRAHLAAETRRTLATLHPAGVTQRLLVVADCRGSIAAELPLPDATLRAGDAGVTVVHLVTEGRHEPSDVRVRITVDDDGDVIIEDLRDPDEPATAAGRLDDMPAGQAEGLARLLAPKRLSLTSLAEQAQVGTVDTAALLGVADGSTHDIRAAWAPRAPRDFLRVPIGVDDHGQPVLLDLKETAELGMGPHGLCVGATGSGKSELLRSLVAGLAATHPPDELAMILVDYKGGAAFAPFADLPHVAGLIDNLAHEPGLTERAHASIKGEVIRRQQVLKDAGNLASVAHYRMLRATRLDLPPLPHLLIVIDEFGELITAKDDFVDLFLTIGRIGRSIGVHLLLSSQRIESGRMRGLDTYLSYRLGLRTFSEAESSMVLDAADAYHLPALPGYGWLKVDTSLYTRFRGAYSSGPSSTVDAPDRTGAATATVRRLPFYPGIRAADDAPEDAEQVRPVSRTVERTALDDLLDAIGGADARRTEPVWLRPLPAVLTLDAVTGAPHAVAGRGLAVESAGRMQVPLGLLDDPGRQRQEAWVLDLTASGGHVAVVGGPQTGKTTWLRTLAVSLALTHTPQQVAIYGLDLTGGGLGAIRELPHVGGVAVRTDPDRLVRTLAEVRGALEHRESVFRDRLIDDVTQLRMMHAAGELPELPSADIVLLVDGGGALRHEFDELDEVVTDLLARGPAYGVHVVAAVSRWNELRLSSQPAFGTRVELRLNDSSDSVIDRTMAATLRADTPGRALLCAGITAQTALPRMDGTADPTTVGQALTDLGRAVDAAWPGRRAPGVRILPPALDPVELPDDIDEPTLVPIGVAESDLAPVLLDLFNTDQHLLVLGDQGCGKTTLLTGIATGLMQRYSKDDLVVALYDRRLSLHGLVPEPYLGGHATNAGLAAGLTRSICRELAQRAPDQQAGSEWDGPRIVVLVDDYDVLTAGGHNPLEEFVEYLPGARDIGLHIVLTRPVAGAARGMWDPVVGLLRDTGSSVLVMDGDRSEGALLPHVYAAHQPPGRGQFVGRGQSLARVQLAQFRRGSS